MLQPTRSSPKSRSRNNNFFTPKNFKIIKDRCDDCPRKVKETIYKMWWQMSSGESHPYIGRRRSGSVIQGSEMKYQRDFSKHFAAVLDGGDVTMATNDPYRNIWNGVPIGNTTHAEGNVFRKYQRFQKRSYFQSEKELRKKES